MVSREGEEEEEEAKRDYCILIIITANVLGGRVQSREWNGEMKNLIKKLNHI